MDVKIKEELIERNKKIIDVIIKQIEIFCPNTIDLIGIAGSFCSGDFYEKSDLDLVIVSNDLEKSDILSKCFILDGIGYDIYISTWDRFKDMSKYENQYVTKLKELDIVYLKNDECLDNYKKYQGMLNVNMRDDASIKNKVTTYFEDILLKYKELLESSSNSEFYKNLGSIMQNIETIIYMVNKEYIRGSTKSIPDELANMKNIPKNFIERYLKLINITNKKEIVNCLKILINEIKTHYNLDVKDITDVSQNKQTSIKRKITGNDITGSYEELFSNYYNKFYHAITIDSQYLSFRTMVDAQAFFDEFYEQFDIPSYNLIGKYNPNDLKANADNFSNILEEWKKLYKYFNKDIVICDDIDKIY